MRRAFYFITLLGLCVTASAVTASAHNLNSLIDKLSSLKDYSGKVTYSVFLPQSEDPVVYEITQSSTASNDSLSPANYLIEWSLNGSDGFSAYFDGNHYRYRDNRLQEYHYDWDSIPFLMNGGGVQQQAQFADILPQFIGRDIDKYLNDTTFVYTYTPDSTYNGSAADILQARLVYHGYTSKEMTYVFDPISGMPRIIEFENNPGAISEQSVTIQFHDIAEIPFALSTEDELIEQYPEVFERFRESNFKVENLPGTPLPAFSAPDIKGDRYTHHRGDGMDNPTIFIVLNDSIESGEATIEAVRRAINRAPVNTDLIIAFTTNNSENAEGITGASRHSDRILLGARGLARDCGVTVYPTILFVDRQGRVADVTLGYNKDLTTVVIQKIALM